MLRGNCGKHRKNRNLFKDCGLRCPYRGSCVDMSKIVAPEVVEWVRQHISGIDDLAGLFFEAAETERKMPRGAHPGRLQLVAMLLGGMLRWR